MKRKEYILLVIGLILLVVSFIMKNNIPTKKSELEKMEEITSVKGENIKSYFYPDTILDHIGNNYIIYIDDKTIIAKLNDKLVKEINNTYFDGMRYRLVGISKKLDQEQINELLKYHNETYFYSNESQIDINEVDEIYGPYYSNDR